MPIPAEPARTISFAPLLLAAIQAGHKTVTRRRVAHPGLQANPGHYGFGGMHADEAYFEQTPQTGSHRQLISCPFGKSGDWLQVLEAPTLWLHIGHISAEPVRAITESQALAEGIVAYPLPAGGERGPGQQYGVRGAEGARPPQSSAIAAFQALLHSIYPTAWERNEWVWVVEFRCITLSLCKRGLPSEPGKALPYSS